MAATSPLPAFVDGPYEPLLKAPVAIEGTDASLATEILPAPPPLAFIRLPINKRPGDLAKKPLPSFLPPSDPGSSYATHSSPAVMSVSGGRGQGVQPRRKRARIDKSPSIRVRNSARVGNALATISPNDPLSGPVSSESSSPPAVQLAAVPSNESTPITHPAASSSLDASKRNGRTRPRTADDKMQVDTEPPKPIERHEPTPFRNDDICASCLVSHADSTASPLSHFLYCDGCTRSFHLGCLDPPIVDENDHPPPDKEWFCAACLAEKNPPRPLRNPTLFDQLIQQQEIQLPQTFQLPDEVRTYFKDVTVGRHGTYLDVSTVKVGRADRHGFLEERDPYRLKDRNNQWITCYKCQRSAAPRSLADLAPSTSTSPTKRGSSSPLSSSPGSISPEPGRQPRKSKTAAGALIQQLRQQQLQNQIIPNPSQIISCDYCNLHWHLDCLNPPLSVMPSASKKWMCPNHAEQVMPPRRTLKNVKIVNVKEPGQPNNGNIEVIPSAEDTATPNGNIPFEEVWINARKYMIPERTIRLDFLDRAMGMRNKGKGKEKQVEPSPSVEASKTYKHLISSSPLSSLTSLSDDEDRQTELEQMKTSSRLVAPETVDPSLRDSKYWADLVHYILADPPPLKPSEVTHSPRRLPQASSSSTSSVTGEPLRTRARDVKAGSTATSFRIRLNRSSNYSGSAGPIANTFTSPSTPASSSTSGITSPAIKVVTPSPPPHPPPVITTGGVVHGASDGNGANGTTVLPNPTSQSSLPPPTLTSHEHSSLSETKPEAMALDDVLNSESVHPTLPSLSTLAAALPSVVASSPHSSEAASASVSVSSLQLSSQEVQQLLMIRSLMVAKGERKLMDFLAEG